MKSIKKHKTSMKQLTKKLAHYERKNTHMIVIVGDCQLVLVA